MLITLSAQVKLPSLLALGFVAMALARRWGGTSMRSGGRRAADGGDAGVMVVIGWASGLGFGWIFTLGVANEVRSWMSLPTLLAWAPAWPASCSGWVTTPPRCWR